LTDGAEVKVPPPKCMECGKMYERVAGGRYGALVVLVWRCPKCERRLEEHIADYRGALGKVGR
jgi:DNA-directed RNA polymerase subunit RPC12/RpoP